MHFLLNDTVFTLNSDDLSPLVVGGRFGLVDFDFIEVLGRELFAHSPLAQHSHAGCAQKLCALIRFAAPHINAALFLAPEAGCKPEDVMVRFASLDAVTIGALQSRHAEGALTPMVADREVWRRMAA